MAHDGHSDLPIEELEEKYRLERAKRLRAEGNAQYKEFSGLYEEFDRDPFADPGFTRDAEVKEVTVAIIGAGFGGMLAAVDLGRAGITDVAIIDKAGDFGGTWYWNRYPGAACDVESYIYLPLLEETGYMPTEKYAKAPEIFAYCQLLGRTFDLYSKALFQTEVEGVDWSDETHRWTVTTNRGDQITARYVVIAGGVLHKAKLPGIEGIESFSGRSFHTSRWDYAYTGGGPFEIMEKLADKRVGIIGTGATAVQVVPKIAASAKELYIFQRTPASVGVRNNKMTDPEWWASLKPGWQTERIRNFTDHVTGRHPEVDLIDDAWTEMLRVDPRWKADTPEAQAELDRFDFENMEKLRARIDEIIEDPELAEKLKPWYGQGCKRPCFHDEYLPTYNRPNVHLIDTDGQGVREIGPNGPIVDGVEYPVDLLVYASGFEVTTDYTHRLGFDPRGRGGQSLSVAWTDGPATLHGVITRGFPNLLMISTVQGGQAINFVHTITGTADHVAKLIDRCIADGIDTIEPTEEAQDAWFKVLMGHMMGVAHYNSICTPGYLNGEGQGDMRSARSAAYIDSGVDYLAHLEAWRDGGLPGTELTHLT